MAHCQDQSVFELLPLYEIRELPVIELERVEEHLSSCEQCQDELLKLEAISRAMSSDPETRRLLRDLAEKSMAATTDQPGWWSRFRERLRLRLRTLVLDYKKGSVISPAFPDEEPEQRESLGNRFVLYVTGSTELRLPLPDQIELAFPLAAGKETSELRCLIRSQDGTVVKEAGLDYLMAGGAGRIILPSSGLVSGTYILEISELQATGGKPLTRFELLIVGPDP